MARDEKKNKKFHIETDPIFDLSCPLQNGRYLINQRRWSGTGWFSFSIRWTNHLVRKDEGIREFSHKYLFELECDDDETRYTTENYVHDTHNGNLLSSTKVYL